jgi:hypothetical protein
MVKSRYRNRSRPKDPKRYELEESNHGLSVICYHNGRRYRRALVDRDANFFDLMSSYGFVGKDLRTLKGYLGFPGGTRSH